MLNQNFGTKELYGVTLRAKDTMQFGDRLIEANEPVLYFDHINISALNEQSTAILARGGYGNMPHVVWEDRSEMSFTFTEGVLNPISFGLLLSAKMTNKPVRDVIYLPKKEGPFEVDDNGNFYLNYTPALDKPIFCYEFSRDNIQKRITNFSIEDNVLTIQDSEAYTKTFLLDYYFEYGEEALIYLIEKERFNGIFSLEGKFYTKDENDGINVTNIIYMPKVRIISSINLRMGERADPTTSTFQVIAMPERTDDSNNLLMRIYRLNEDIDSDF